MNYTMKHITTEPELDAALVFDENVFGVPSERHSHEYARERWLERMKEYGDLMLYAESGSEIIGIVFGRVENNGSITVGPVAVDERFRGHGIARELMLLLEKRALERGVHMLTLGAVESAEGFYKKMGYTGQLLIQSKKHSIEALLSLNPGHPVVFTNIHDDTVNQVCLKPPQADRALQQLYESTLEGCHTQTMFWKHIQD